MLGHSRHEQVIRPEQQQRQRLDLNSFFSSLNFSLITKYHFPFVACFSGHQGEGRDMEVAEGPQVRSSDPVTHGPSPGHVPVPGTPHWAQLKQGGDPTEESDETHNKEHSHSFGSLQIGFSIPAPILWTILTCFSPEGKFFLCKVHTVAYSSQDPSSFSRKSRSTRQLHIPHNTDKICCLIRHWHVYYNLYRRVTCAEESFFFLVSV